VHVSRVGRPNAFCQQDLSRCVIDQVSTADDVCHVLESVIDDNGELIGPESVGSPNTKSPTSFETFCLNVPCHLSGKDTTPSSTENATHELGLRPFRGDKFLDRRPVANLRLRRQLMLLRVQAHPYARPLPINRSRAS